MALNWNTTSRIFIDTLPQVSRAPVWSDRVFYAPGSIIVQYFGDSDSEVRFTNWYVSRRSITPGQAAPSVNNNWTLFISTDPAAVNLFGDSDIYNYIGSAESDYNARFITVDSDIQLINQKLIAFDELDSDLTFVESRTTVIENKLIIDKLADSEAIHDHAIIWDSDLNKFKFSPLVQTVNNKTPDSNGNIEITLARTKVGSRDERLDSDEDGTFFIVASDSDSEHNGTLYIYNEDTHAWQRIVGYTDVENDRLYVNAAGDTMTGALKALTPVSDSDVATKAYVDNFSDNTKQDLIIVYDSEFAFDPTGLPENTIARLKTNETLWVIKNGVFVKFVIPVLMSSDLAITEAKVVNLANSIIRVMTHRFSQVEVGRLYVYKDNVLTPYSVSRNCLGDFAATGILNNFRLINSTDQSFDIDLSTTPYAPNSIYTIRYVSHDGVETSVSIKGYSTNRIAYSNASRSLNYGIF